MRALLCLTLISALCSNAQAATPISPDAASDLKNNIQGQYRLENGRDVHLVRAGKKLYLDLNRHYRRELLPVADNVLASHDGKLTVQFIADGPVDRIVIAHPGLPDNVRIGERKWRR